MDSLESLLDAVAAVGEKFRGRYEGAAVSMPGRIDIRTGVAHTGGAFDFIQDTPAGQLFAGRLGCPVTVANDAKCAANAEAWTGALAGTANGAVLVLGTGTGGGIVLNHRIWMGRTFAAGELSLFAGAVCRLWADAARRGAQRRGGPVLVGPRLGHRPAAGLCPPQEYPDGGAGRPAVLCGLRRRRARGRRGPGGVRRDDGGGIYAVQSVLDLEKYAIGGGISARPEVTGIIRAKLDEIYAAVPFTAFGKPEIVRCRYGNDANLIGALRFALHGID